jgi:hypothetical protein
VALLLAVVASGNDAPICIYWTWDEKTVLGIVPSWIKNILKEVINTLTDNPVVSANIVFELIFLILIAVLELLAELSKLEPGFITK